MISGMLFMEAMEDNEAIWIQGFETFSTYEGYARTLKFIGDYQDPAQVFNKGKLVILMWCAGIPMCVVWPYALLNHMVFSSYAMVLHDFSF